MSDAWRSVLLVASTGAMISVAGLGLGLLWGLSLWALLQLSDGERANLQLRELRAEEARAQGLDPSASAGVQVLEASGPLLFTSVPKIDGLLAVRPPWPSELVLDLRRVTHIDGSALAALDHLIECLEVRGGRCAIVCRPRSPLLAQLRRCGLAGRALGETCCFTLTHALERVAARHPRPHDASVEVKKRPLGALRLLRLPPDPAH